MDAEQARKFLDISEYADIDEIKRKYRRLMGRFHPDVLGSENPEHIRKAQEINEAYQILKSAARAGNVGFFEGNRKKWKWSGELNKKAFCARNVYLYYSMETDGEKLYYQVARGKYMWDPEEEEFSLFMRSIFHAVKELMEEAEEKILSEKRRTVKISEKERFQIQAQIVHCLLQQFTDPIKILRRIVQPERTDRQGRDIYRFTALLILKDKFRGTAEKNGMRAGSFLYPESLRDNRISVRAQNRQPLGYLTFLDDRLYLCIIPLLKNKMAQIKMIVSEKQETRGRSGNDLKIKVDFYFRLEDQGKEYRNPDQNLRIAEILRVYEKKRAFCNE